MHGSLRLRTRLRRFLREEDGSITIFTILILMFMLVVAGMAIDMMRHETARARLQSVTDRAILAAADLSQVYSEDWTAEDVVRDYFEKAGLLDQLESVIVTETINSRTVSAEASLGIGTHFMRLAGVDSLTAAAAGTADESVSDIEIVLVLDVSGSMVDNGVTRLANLKGAAKNFVQMILDQDDENRISIALVPFNGQVNLGPDLAALYNLQERVTTPANVHCVDLPLSAYTTPSLTTTTPLPATAWADTFTGTYRDNAYRHYSSSWNGITYGQPVAGNRWCQDIPGNFVRPPSHSIEVLQAAIDDLVGEGATSINAGMRWGMTLLDPASQPVFDALVASGDIPDDFAAPSDGDTRPFAYDRGNTRKIIVLMTDGQNYPEERVIAPYRSGNSPIWRQNDGNRNYSILQSSRLSSTNSTERCRPFWVPHYTGSEGRWHVRPWNGNASGIISGCYSASATYTNVTRQTWPQVWTELRLPWVAWQLYARSGLFDYATQMNAFRTKTDSAVGTTPTMDGQLDAMCDLAKENSITVYGIAFEAPEQGRSVIRDCSSSDSHYFYTTTSEIDSTFNTIAANIIALRLTQ